MGLPQCAAAPFYILAAYSPAAIDYAAAKLYAYIINTIII